MMDLKEKVKYLDWRCLFGWHKWGPLKPFGASSKPREVCQRWYCHVTKIVPVPRGKEASDHYQLTD